MRSTLGIASTFLFSLSLALAAVGFAAGRAEAFPPPKSCPTGIDINGLPTCPPNSCGAFNPNCAWHNVYIDGVYVGVTCAC